jgi:hypothetical protein
MKLHLMRDYLVGSISVDVMRRTLSKSRDTESQRLLRMVEIDRQGRNVLRDLQPPERAAERLAQAILSPDLSSTILHRKKGLGLLKRILNPLEFDVIGAGQPASVSKAKRKPKKGRTQATRKKRT